MIWLKENSGVISAIAAVVQAVVVVVGIGFVIWELRLGSMARSTSAISNALQLSEELRSIDDSEFEALSQELSMKWLRGEDVDIDVPNAFDIINRSYKIKAPIYLKLHTCIVNESCSPSTIESFACRKIVSDHFQLIQIGGQIKRSKDVQKFDVYSWHTFVSRQSDLKELATKYCTKVFREMFSNVPPELISVGGLKKE